MEDKDSYISALEDEVERLRTELRKKELRKLDAGGASTAPLTPEEVDKAQDPVSSDMMQWDVTFDVISDPIFVSDNQMRIIRVNRAYNETTGLPSSSIIGRYFYDIFPVMDKPFSGSDDEDISTYIKDESEIAIPEMGKVFKVRRYPLRGKGGEDVSIVHIMEDITEQSLAHDRTKALLEINQLLKSNMSLDFRFMETCKYVVKLGYEMAWIGSLHSNLCEIVKRAHSCKDTFVLKMAQDGGGEEMPGIAPAKRASTTKDVVVVNGISVLAGGGSWRESVAEQGCHSLAALPLIHLDEVIGVLVVLHSKDEIPQQEVDFLKSFTNYAASAIKNSQLMNEINSSEKKIKEEMELSENLLALSRASFATTDLDRLLGRIVECSANIMMSDYSLIFLWNDERNAYMPAQSYGLPARHYPIFRSSVIPVDDILLEGLSREAVIRHGEGIISEFPEIMTIAVIPLVSIDKKLGINIIGFLKERSFKPREILLMNGMASQISVALHEAFLYRESLRNSMELSRRVETIQVLYEIDKAILSCRDVGDMLETASRMAVRLIPSDSVFVGLTGKELKSFTYAAGFGVEGLSKGEDMSLEASTARNVVRSLTPEFVADLREVNELLPLEQAFLDSGIISFVRVPLIVKNQTIGFLSVGAKRAAAFTSEDLYTLEKLAGQVSIGVENARLLKDLEELFIGTISSLTKVIDAKCQWTSGHSRRVARTSKLIGREMGLDKESIKRLDIAAHLHDIGKIGVYESVLNKTDKLTDDELTIMRRHAVKGAEILAHIKQLEDVVPSIRSHQEYYDGSGYPDGLRGTDIPFYARIIAVADTIDSMMEDRPYRTGMPDDVVISELKKCSGTQFDPEVVDAFLRVYGSETVRIQSSASGNEKAS